MTDKRIFQIEYIPLFGIWKLLEVGSYPSQNGICGPEGELDTSFNCLSTKFKLLQGIYFSGLNALQYVNNRF